MKKRAVAMFALCCAAGAMAAEFMVSIESNEVLLMAEGLEPGTACSVESAAGLSEPFTNMVAFFADSNGIASVAVPMTSVFMVFRVQQEQGSSVLLVPEGMVEIPVGTNSGTDPDFGAYSLTNESPFYMDATEVTKTQWDEVYNWAVTNGYSFTNTGSGRGTNYPVHYVNWYDCVKWCNARSEKDGKTPCYTVSNNVYKTGEVLLPDCDFDVSGYRLPTSDEWEFAARGGVSGKRFWWGDTITHSNANYYSSSSYAYDTSETRGDHPDYAYGEFPHTSPAGDFAANGYGLFDILGNVSEWCTDWTTNYAGVVRIVRGGSWFWYASNLRCGDVGISYPYTDSYALGFRAVCR